KCVVARVGYVIRGADRAITGVRPQGIDVDTRVSQDRTSRHGIKIQFLLSVQASPAYIGHLDRGLESDLALCRHIPAPSLGIPENRVLSGDRQGKRVPRASARVVHRAHRHRTARLKRRIPAEEYRVAYAETREVAAYTGSDDSLVVETISNAQAGL